MDEKEFWIAVITIVENRKSPKTTQALKIALAQWLRFLTPDYHHAAVTHAVFIQATRIQVELFVAHLKRLPGLPSRHDPENRTLAPASIAQKIELLKGLYRDLVKASVCPTNPFEGYDTRKFRRNVKRPTERIPRPVVRRALRLFPLGTERNCILNLYFATGCRRGEILNLRYRDVHLDESGITLQLRSTKTGAAVQQVATFGHRPLLAYLQSYPFQPNDKLFSLTIEQVRTLFKKIDHPNATPHSARATMVTRLKEQDFDDREVADWCRLSVKMVKTYDRRTARQKLIPQASVSL